MKPEVQIGKPIDRVDGFAKVTGQAKYAGEFHVPDLAYGVVVSGGIAKGKIKHLDTERAEQVPGVLKVFTHENRPNLAWFNRKYQDDDAPPGAHFRPLYDNKIYYNGQPIALVVADSFEAARYAASLVKADYEVESHQTNLHEVRGKGYQPRKTKEGTEKPKSRGHAEKAFQKSAIKIESEFSCSMEHHNPMEMHASTVVLGNDGEFTVYDKTQGVQNSQQYVCNIFGLSKDKVKVLSPFVGGAFGSGLRPQYQLFLAMMAATELKRSTRVTLTRQQMFSFGHRPESIQNLKLSSDEQGTLQSIEHHCVGETSRFEDYTENTVTWSGTLYQCENVDLKHIVSPIDVYTPLDMRAPGAATGVYALECAMDELASAAGMDPVEFRIKNFTDKDQTQHDRPFSSKELKECYRLGAEKFGWSKRNPLPRSMREGKKLIGWGMATGVWEAIQSKCAAKACLSKDGTLTVSSGTSDIGTGTYTIMTQIAAESMGLPIEKVKAVLGDSSLPTAPLQGGSWTAASVGTAVQDACMAVLKRVHSVAKELKDSPFYKVKLEDTAAANGFLFVRAEPSKRMSFTEILAQGKLEKIEEEAAATPNMAKQAPYSRNTHSAVFAEVHVDSDYGMIDVTRVVSAVAAGRILNPKTARSQILGGVVWGIGMALHEKSVMDHRLGRIMNHNLAEYHIPVSKDVGEIEVLFVPEHDDIVNPLGVKGLGEIGIVGAAAAIANAVYHATGKRVRKLPILLDDLI